MDSYVSFPKLGWTIPLEEEIFSIPFFNTEISVRWYGLLIAVGFLLATLYGFRNAKRFGIEKDPMLDVVLTCVVMAFIGARLYYVFFSDDRAQYLANPITILYVWQGGLAIYGGVIGAFVTGLWMCPLRKVDTLRMFDIASIGFLIGQAIGRWGNFFNQEAFGGNTELPWGMSGSWISSTANPLAGVGYDPAVPVHPTFLYESLWCVLGFVLLHIVSRKAYQFRGQLFAMYIMWYGTGRFFIELLRTDSLYLFTMKVSCLVALLSVLGGAILFFVFKNLESHRAEAIDDEVTIPLADPQLVVRAAESEEKEVVEEDTHGEQN
ncbi:MAG: prolipoprotein diacylglyceryl transferase [Clostridia bacterium]|nr:prolipoprotein diacylglyceryl transferase [Clostridia bacterium]